MKTFILLLLFFIPLLGLAQHNLTLTTGENLDGRLLSYSKGKIIFLFKDNTMIFADSQVSAINFRPITKADNDKPIHTMPARLHGVIAYFFNDNYGHRPDVGAEVYIVPTNRINIDSTAILHYRIVRLITQISENENKPMSDSVKTTIAAIDLKAFQTCLAIKESKQTIKLVADGNGSFSTELLSGSYYVLIVSQHRKDTSITEIEGKIDFTIVTLKSGADSSVNAKFGL